MKKIEKISISLIIIGILWIIIATPLFMKGQYFNTANPIDTDKFNHFGGFISGTVGIVLSLASIILFYITLKEQRVDFAANREAVNLQVKALEQQIKEFELQRLELKETRKVFKEQSKTQNLQRFENTFFNLLNVHHQIVNAMDFTKIIRKSVTQSALYRLSNQLPPTIEKEILLGRDMFKHTYMNLLGAISKDKENYADIYLAQYEQVQTDFGHYFRNLYRIIKFVHTSNFASNELQEEGLKKDFLQKYSYTSMIRAQLSDFELGWIFYNCLSENGEEDFKPLIEEYCLFKNLDNKLIPFVEHKDIYEKSAFDKKELKYFKNPA